MINTRPPHERSPGGVPCGCQESVAPEVHGLTWYQNTQDGPAFELLRGSYRRFAFRMTAVFLAVYFSYVLLSGYAHGFMAMTVVGNVNVAFVLGLLQFAMTFLIAWLYTRHAGSRLDPVAEQVRAEFADTQDHQAGARQDARDSEGCTCAQ
ncbi:hypothetical protein GCM10009665_14820 [Kitasatospora nipponensis]|uniref:DUF485 domain-containing protein n=1 Tax=Kitasatospora nipponensis TaxID=258049 RepID=A0ABN1VZF0_9ACTN